MSGANVRRLLDRYVGLMFPCLCYEIPLMKCIVPYFVRSEMS